MAGSSSPQIRNICVFDGSSPGKEKEFLESANHLGQVLAERKIHLVYDGGSLRLMGVCQ
jgi:predicted Rossmann-fold nucleotide-binding protein